MFGHRSIYHENWRAVCPFPGPSFAEAAEKGRYFGGPLTADVLADLDENAWELYDLNTDPTETTNVAEDHPQKLTELIELWYEEADRYGVLPLATADMARMNVERPSIARPRTKYVYQPGGAAVPFAASPRVYNRAHSITAELNYSGEAEGVLIAHGNRHGGYTLFIQDGRLHYVHNYLGRDFFRVSSPEPLPTGDLVVRYEFEPTAPPDFTVGKGAAGRGQLYVNSHLVASNDFEFTVPNLFGIIGVSCGRDGIDSVSPDDYPSPFEFTGELSQVTIDVSGDVIIDTEAELQRLMTQQ
jgi:arylsulfatase